MMIAFNYELCIKNYALFILRYLCRKNQINNKYNARIYKRDC